MAERIEAGRRRVLARVLILGPDECWPWQGATLGNGYGALNVRLGGRDAPQTLLLAHRVSYEHHVGPIPDGTEIDHLCGNKRCANPRHLEAVTHGENTRRATTKSDDVPCPRGHTGDFRRHTDGHGRMCRACRRERPS